MISGGKMSANKTAHIDSVSFRELAEESAAQLSKLKTAGPNLVQPEKNWKFTPGKQLLDVESKSGMITLSSRQKTINAIMSQKLKLIPGKSYRLELNSRSDENLAITVGIKNSAAKLQKSFESSSSWQTHVMNFTAPEKADSGVFSIWIGKITPGKKIFFRNIKCRELQK